MTDRGRDNVLGVTERGDFLTLPQTWRQDDNIYCCHLALSWQLVHFDIPEWVEGVPIGAPLNGLRPTRISPEDLLAGIYPDGDIRNLPYVRKWMAEARRDRLYRKPIVLESWETRFQRRCWNDVVSQLETRLRDDRHCGENRLVSLEVCGKLEAVLADIRRDLGKGAP